VITGSGILPTPVIGMVGLVEEVSRIVQPGFKSDGDLIALLGETRDDLSISEYAAVVGGRGVAEMIAAGSVPALSLERERAVQETCLKAIDEGLLRSAHDCSDGGLAVAVAESCFSTLGRAAVGADIELPGEFGAAAQLFSESPSRIVVSFAPSARARLEEIAAAEGCPVAVVGRAGGSRLRVSVAGREVVAREVAELERAWRTSLADRLRAEALAAAAE
jgi:phosphoribosylformylglycinamidine synthase